MTLSQPVEQSTVIEPAVLYLGTPVVLVSTLNQDRTANLAPMSSAWWLGWTCVLGFDASSHTVGNLRRERECVLNLPSADLAAAVDRLARTSGSFDMPMHKQAMGYEHVPDKFSHARLSPVPAETIGAPRVAECPVQLEATVESIRPIADNDPHMLIPAVAVEVRIRRVHAHHGVLSREFRNRIDPQRWNPLLMSFLEYFTVGPLDQSSRLRDVDEEFYAARTPEPINRQEYR